MNKEYKIFDKGFNKILDLISIGENETSDKFAKFVKLLPYNVKEETQKCCDFETQNEDCEVSYSRLVNAIDFEFVKLKPYLRFEIYVHKLFKEDLSPKKIFSLKVNNLMGANYKDFDISWEVYLDYNDFGPYLEFKKTLCGNERYLLRKQISYYELERYLETEEQYEDDWEIEFDADFEV